MLGNFFIYHIFCSKKIISDFEHAKEINSYFDDFVQVKLLLRWLLLGLLLLRWLLFKWLSLIWLFLRWLLLRSSLCKTPLGETGCLGNPYFLFYWLPNIQFTPNTVSQAAYGYLPSLCNTCVTYLMSRHWSPGTSHPIIIQRSG